MIILMRTAVLRSSVRSDSFLRDVRRLEVAQARLTGL